VGGGGKKNGEGGISVNPCRNISYFSSIYLCIHLDSRTSDSREKWEGMGRDVKGCEGMGRERRHGKGWDCDGWDKEIVGKSLNAFSVIQYCGFTSNIYL